MESALCSSSCSSSSGVFFCAAKTRIRRRRGGSRVASCSSSSSSGESEERCESNTNDNKCNNRRKMLFASVASSAAFFLSAKDDASKAFTVGGDNLSGSNETFVGDFKDEDEAPYTTKDLVLDFVSPIVALRVVNIAFNGGMGGSPKWLDYLCVAGVGLVVWVFATDYSGLDAALH